MRETIATSQSDFDSIKAGKALAGPDLLLGHDVAHRDIEGLRMDGTDLRLFVADADGER
jgi:hypothetical protein